SKAGWIRAAKGHDVDAESLNFRSGDGFLAAAPGRSNDHLVVLGARGRSYSLTAHKLPSARSQGEPLTSLVTPANNAAFVGLVLGRADLTCVLASTTGSGFVTTLGEMTSRQKSGKATINPGKNGTALPPTTVTGDDPELCVVTSSGHLLCVVLEDLPHLSKGKGNKLIALKAGETVVAVQAVSDRDQLIIYSGKRHMVLKPSERDAYRGPRASRGKKLPRGF